MKNELSSHDKDKEITNRIQSYLNKADKSRHKNIKILTVVNLMNYLSTEIDFIKKHENFKLCVLHKCESLKKQLPENIPPLLLEQFNQSINTMNDLLK